MAGQDEQTPAGVHAARAAQVHQEAFQHSAASKWSCRKWRIAHGCWRQAPGGVNADSLSCRAAWASEEQVVRNMRDCSGKSWALTRMMDRPHGSFRLEVSSVSVLSLWRPKDNLAFRHKALRLSRSQSTRKFSSWPPPQTKPVKPLNPEPLNPWIPVQGCTLAEAQAASRGKDSAQGGQGGLIMLCVFDSVIFYASLPGSILFCYVIWYVAILRYVCFNLLHYIPLYACLFCSTLLYEMV